MMFGVLQLGIALIFLSANVLSFDDEHLLKLIDQRFEALVDRIQALESKDAANDARTATMEAEFARREMALMSRIMELESQAKSGLSRRAAHHAEVAFFAVGPNFDFSNMAANQSVTYATPTTNIGNAFHSGAGEFIAPVSGTYVFSVTICGKLDTTNNFNVDLNGAIKVKLFIGPTLSQTSQSIVIEMRAGDSLSVKSGRSHNALYGSYYTSISGFLLFERSSPFG